MTSYRKAIRRMCKSCIYDPTEPGTWVQQTTMCTAMECELWPYRPKIDPKSKGAHEKVVRLMEASRVGPMTIRKCLGQTKPENGTYLCPKGEPT